MSFWCNPDEETMLLKLSMMDGPYICDDSNNRKSNVVTISIENKKAISVNLIL